MKRESLVFLLGGFAFGILVGFALFHAIQNPPALSPGGASTGAGGAVAGPVGDGLPTGSSAGVGGAPMVKRINQLRRDLEQNPQNLAASAELADIYQRAGMWEQAAGYYEQALQVDPDQPQLLVNLGLCYRGLERYDAALETFERAQKIDPDNWHSLFNTVVVAALDLGRFEVAVDAMDALDAMAGSPDGPDTDQLRQLREWLLEARAAAAGEG